MCMCVCEGVSLRGWCDSPNSRVVETGAGVHTNATLPGQVRDARQPGSLSACGSGQGECLGVLAYDYVSVNKYTWVCVFGMFVSIPHLLLDPCPEPG